MRASHVVLGMTLVVISFTSAGLLAAQSQSPDASDAAIESYRDEMFEVASLYAQVGDNLGNPGVRELAGDLASSVARLTDEDVSLLLSLGVEVSNLVAATKALAEVTDPASALEPPSALGSQGVLGTSPLPLTTLPDAPYNATCPPPRSSTLGLQIAINVLHVARTVLAVAQRGCDFVPGGAVAAGFGVIVGNPQTLACSPFDIALDVAQAVVENFQFCDADIDSAEILGSYNRLGHIHTDLEAHDAHIQSELAAHDLNIDGDLVAHDQRISSQLATHDLDLKLQLATHDADIKALLGNIQQTVDENQRLIKIFMARQLETMRLMITPQGRRVVDADVLTCSGSDCPEFPAFQLCPNGSLKWNCRR